MKLSKESNFIRLILIMHRFHSSETCSGKINRDQFSRWSADSEARDGPYRTETQLGQTPDAIGEIHFLVQSCVLLYQQRNQSYSRILGGQKSSQKIGHKSICADAVGESFLWFCFACHKSFFII